MTRDEAVSFIQKQLAHRTGLNTTIVSDLQSAQVYLESGSFNQSWFLLSERATRVCVAGERRLPLPADFIVEAEEDALMYVPEDGTDDVPLEKDDYDTLQAAFPSSVTGLPVQYSLDGLYFNLWPKPNAAYTFAMRYYKKAATLDTNIENVWLKYAPMVLIGQAGLFTANGLRDAAAQGTFQQLMVQASQTLMVQNEARKHSNREYQMGGPEN